MNVNENHYIKDGKKYHRVSNIVKAIVGNKYKNIPSKILEAAADFGTTIHSAIEALGKNILSKDEILKDMLDTPQQKKVFKEYLKATKGWEVLEQEQTYFTIEHDKRAINFAGTIDMVAKINGKTTIVDFKTRAKLESEDNYLSEKLQLALYKLLYLENNEYDGNIELAILILDKKTYKSKLIKIEILEEAILLKLLKNFIEKKHFNDMWKAISQKEIEEI